MREKCRELREKSVSEIERLGRSIEGREKKGNKLILSVFTNS